MYICIYVYVGVCTYIIMLRWQVWSYVMSLGENCYHFFSCIVCEWQKKLNISQKVLFVYRMLQRCIPFPFPIIIHSFLLPSYMKNINMWFYVHSHGHNTDLLLLFKPKKLYDTIHLMKQNRGPLYIIVSCKSLQGCNNTVYTSTPSA